MTHAHVPAVQHHASNRDGRDFVIGDLHGCVDALRYLLREAGFDASRDRLFSVGDLVDRGDQCEEALTLIDKPWFYPVLGNHEDTMCAVAEGHLPRYRWYGIGGAWAETLAEGELVREAMHGELLAHLAERLGGVEGRRRAALFGAQMGGLIFTRYLLRLEPIASMNSEEIVRMYAPALRTVLFGRGAPARPRSY